MASRLRGGAMERLRIVAPALVQRDYLPDLLDRVKRRVPGFQFALRLGPDEGSTGGGEFEVVLETLGGRRVPGRHCRELGRLPLALLIPRKARIRSAASLWPEGRGVLPLITLADDDPVCRVFQTELRRREIIWSPAFELANLDLVIRYVAAGYGVGLGLLPPGMKLPQGVEAVFPDDFPPVTLAISWAGTPSPAARVFIEEAELLARELFATR
jgi:DNA-binding transcriptional LysR family regulator